MHQGMLCCLKFKKTIFLFAIALLVFCLFGLRFILFDFKLNITEEGRFSTQTAYITVYDKHLLDNEHLALLAKMHEELLKIKAIHKITSLYTMPNIRRYLDEKEWRTVIENKPYSGDSLDLMKSDVLDNELFVGKFINKQADTMLIYLDFGRDKYGALDLEVRGAIQEVLDQYKGAFSKLFQSGHQELIYTLSKTTLHDLSVCIPLIVVLMCLLFGGLFRSALMAFLPLSIAIYSIICAVGMMGWLGVPVSELFLLAIGLALAITVASNSHIVYAYQEGMRHFPELSAHDHLAYMLKKVLFPLLLATFTALLGFLVDVLSGVRILQDLTYAFAFCVIVGTFATVFVVPILLTMIRMPKANERLYFNKVVCGFLRLNDLLVMHAKKMAIIVALISILGLVFATHLTIESLPFNMFKKNDPFIKNIDFSSRQVSGQNVLQIDLFSKQKNIFLEPKHLQKILDEEKKLLNLPGTSHIYSIADVIASTNKIFMFNAQGFFKIPQTPVLLKNYYRELLKQNSMSILINKDFNMLSVFINYNIYTSSLSEQYKETIRESLKEGLKGSPLQFKIKDYWTEYAQIMDNLIILQILSIGTIYLICFVVIGLMFRSAIAGFISIIPNVLPLCIIAVTQYISDIPVSLISVILYSIVVGLSIDETAHIFYTYKQEYWKSQDRVLAAKAALRSQIIPVTIASFTIALACIALLSSQFLPVLQLSFLICVGVLSTWLSGLVVTPFLMQKIDITKNIKGKNICSTP